MQVVNGWCPSQALSCPNLKYLGCAKIRVLFPSLCTKAFQMLQNGICSTFPDMPKHLVRKTAKIGGSGFLGVVNEVPEGRGQLQLVRAD